MTIKRTEGTETAARESQTSPSLQLRSDPPWIGWSNSVYLDLIEMEMFCVLLS